MIIPETTANAPVWHRPRVVFRFLLLAAILVSLCARSSGAVAAPTGADLSLTPPEPRLLSQTEPTVVMVLLPAVNLAELVDTPTVGIHSLLTSGAVGVMNTRTGPNMAGRLSRAIDSLVRHPEEMRPTTLESACLTIGAGTRTFARGEAGQAYEAEERVGRWPASALWAQRTGQSPQQDRIYQVFAPSLAARQSRLSYPAAPGALGQALREAGILTAVVGNADDESGPHREVVCIAMDAQGRVPLGSVGEAMSIADPLAPGGRRTNAEALLVAVEDAVTAGARFVVVETGDTARVDRATDEVQPEMLPQHRKRAIQAADVVVRGLLRRLDPELTLLMLVTTTPLLDRSNNARPLAPVILAGAGVTRGQVFSPSTRTPGLATNTDLAPTVLHFLKVPAPTQMVGRPLTSVRDLNAPAKVMAAETRFGRIEGYARPLVRWLAWAQALLLAAFLIFAWARPRPAPELSRAAQTGALALAALPTAVLLCGLFVLARPTSGAALLLLLLAALTGGAMVLRRGLAPALALWMAGSALCVYDLLTGNQLLFASPLGYSPYLGARFYGIGNEGVGLIVPMLFLAALGAGVMSRRKAGGGTARIHLSVVAGGVVLLLAAAAIGHPAIGANFGGALAAGTVGITAIALELRGCVSRRVLVVLAALLLALVAVPMLLELTASAERQSHIGRAMALLRGGELSDVWAIAARKLNMSFRLLRFSPWSRLLLAATVVLVYLNARYGARLRAEYPALRNGAIALVVGAVVAQVANDSGVQPAAEILTALAAAGVLFVARMEKDEAPAEST